jgi:SAM-dependent methyltransferase
MNSPWLDVSLADYEGHMALPGIEQAQLLSDIFSGVLEQFSPRSVAVIGCAGGNGFDRIPSSISRVVGVDVNPHFIAETETRFRGRLKNLKLVVGDIQSHEVSFAPVDLMFLGLILEYVNVETVIARTPSMLTVNGHLATVLQLPSVSHRQVSPSPFPTVQALGEVVHLVRRPGFKMLLRLRVTFSWSHAMSRLKAANSFSCKCSPCRPTHRCRGRSAYRRRAPELKR